MIDKEKLQRRIDELILMTDKFCNEHINAEYAAFSTQHSLENNPFLMFGSLGGLFHF